MTSSSSVTFDVALVPDGLQRGPAGQELLQLVSGLLVVGAVHAGRALHGCGETGQDADRHQQEKLSERRERDEQQLQAELS